MKRKRNIGLHALLLRYYLLQSNRKFAVTWALWLGVYRFNDDDNNNIHSFH